MDEPAARIVHTLSESHPFEPIVVNRAAKPIGRALKVVAFNALGGARLDEIVHCLSRPPLQNPDLLLLSEADWRRKRSAWREFAAELAQALKLSFAYVGEFGDREPHGVATRFKGNAILSSQPLADVIAVPIPNRFAHRRLKRMLGGPAGIVARIKLGERTVAAGVVHLNSRWDPPGREWQMREYLRALPEKGPAIIGGDWNTTTVGLYGPDAFLRAALTFLLRPKRLADPTRWEPLFAHVARHGLRIDGANAPKKRTFTPSGMLPYFLRPNLDWIALRDLEPVRGSARVVRARPRLLSPRISDHDFVTCEVRV